MAQVVLVHGVGQQYGGARLLEQRWVPAVRDGLERAGHPAPDEVDVSCAFYGDIFRPAGKALSAFTSPLGASDVSAGLESDLLMAWWEQTAALEPGQVPGPDAKTKARMPGAVQRALWAMSQSRFWSDHVGERVLVADLRQVRLYLEDPEIRATVMRRVSDEIDCATRVVVGHSLGAVVAYEVLCAHPAVPVEVLVTLGAPLAIPHLVCARLKPAPVDGIGAWPGPVRRWVNIADRGDAVALGKSLKHHFAGPVEDHIVHNGATAHDAVPYLSSAATGKAIMAGLGA